MKIFLFLPLILLGSAFAASVRPGAVAGAWYPDDPKALRTMVEGFLTKANPPVVRGKIRAVIVPHAGFAYSGQTAAYTYKLLKGRTYKRIILMGTSHYSGHEGVSVGDYDAYQTPLGRVPVDRKVVKKLLREKLFSFIPAAHVREHSLEAQLPFLQVVLPGVPIVPLLPGYRTTLEDDRAIARALEKVIDDDTLVVISSDFTHYGSRYRYVPFTDNVQKRLEELDMGAFKLLSSGFPADFDLYTNVTGATICGQRPLRILMALFPKGATSLLHYTTSGRLMHDDVNSVSYIAAALTQEKLTWVGPPRPEPLSGKVTKAEREELLKLSRAALHSRLFGSDHLAKALLALPHTGHLTQIAGAFVTLNEAGRLRGCIGYIVGIKPLYEAVVDNTLSAASHDPRFSPVNPSEYNKITIEISVLSPLKVVASSDAIVLGRDGVVLEKNGRRAVYLPQVATETGWSKEKFLSHLSRKAGLESDAWRNGARFSTFTAQVFDEEDHP